MVIKLFQKSKLVFHFASLVSWVTIIKLLDLRAQEKSVQSSRTSRFFYQMCSVNFILTCLVDKEPGKLSTTKQDRK